MILGPSDGIDDNQRWSFIGKATKLNKTVNLMQFRSISVWIESHSSVLLSIITSTTTTTIIITITLCLCCGTILSSVLSNEKVRRRVCNKGK